MKPLGMWHSWTLPNGGNGDREEVTVEFEHVWRKQPCIVEVMASRYEAGARDHMTWTEWRVYARRATGFDPETQRRTGDLTDTARARLGAELVPLVEEWLANDPEYKASRQRAVYRAILRELPTAFGAGGSVTSAGRHAVRLRDELTVAQCDTIGALVDSWTAYADALADALAEAKS